MLEIFRQNHFLNSLLLLPYAVILGIDTLISPQPLLLEHTSSFYQWTFSGLTTSPLTASIIAIMLLFIQGAMINRLIIKHRLSRLSSLLPGVVYILLMNALPDIRGFHDILIANTFVILFFTDMLQLLRKYKTEKLMFNLGLWTALSTLIYPGYIVLLGLIVLAIFILRSFSVKEVGQSIAGFMTIIVLTSTIFYLNGTLWAFLPDIFQFNAINISSAFDISSLKSIFILMVTYFLLIFCLLNNSQFFMKQTIKEQKKINLVYWSLLLFCLSIFFNNHLSQQGLLTLAFPIAALVGMFLAIWKQKVIAEIIHLCVVLGILFMHLQIMM